MVNQSTTTNQFEFWKEFLQKSSTFWSQAAKSTQPPDPSQVWRDFAAMWSDAWIKSFSQAPAGDMPQRTQKLWTDQLDAMTQAFSKVMSTEAFSSMMGKTIEQGLAWQEKAAKAVNPQIDSALQVLNLPSRSQIQRLFERVIDIEERLDAIEESTRHISKLLDAGSANASKAAGKAPSRASHR